MALDFPSSPTVGQQYNGYVWDGTAWDSTSAQPIALSTTAPGYNAVINGAFDIWQRGTSFSNPNNVYTADRWMGFNNSHTVTVSQQTFAPGAAPVAGYEGTYFVRFARTALSGTADSFFLQKIEDVRTFAGQTATVSFWAKADAAKTITVYAEQNFGSGGSSTVSIGSSSISLTTSWQRFNATFTVPSISGKTIGTGSFFGLGFDLLYAAGVANFDIWGVQLEAGSTATAFRRNAPSIQAELAACQRYAFLGGAGAVGRWNSGSAGEAWISFPTAMRTGPSVTHWNNYSVSVAGITSVTATGTTFANSTNSGAQINVTSSGATTGAIMGVSGNGILFSAEL